VLLNTSSNSKLGRNTAYTLSTVVLLVLICNAEKKHEIIGGIEPSETLSAERVKELADELSERSKQQSKALQASAYISMDPEEAQNYDKRRQRIAELCSLIGKLRPSRTGI
jgi:hypothetical protein